MPGDQPAWSRGQGVHQVKSRVQEEMQAACRATRHGFVGKSQHEKHAMLRADVLAGAPRCSTGMGTGKITTEKLYGAVKPLDAEAEKVEKLPNMRCRPEPTSGGEGAICANGRKNRKRGGPNYRNRRGSGADRPQCESGVNCGLLP